MPHVMNLDEACYQRRLDVRPAVLADGGAMGDQTALDDFAMEHASLCDPPDVAFERFLELERPDR